VLTRDLMRQEGLTADQAIARYKQGSIRREFPGQYLDVHWMKSNRTQREENKLRARPSSYCSAESTTNDPGTVLVLSANPYGGSPS